MTRYNSNKSLKKFHKRKFCLFSCIEKIFSWKNNYKLRKYEKYPQIKEICLEYIPDNKKAEELYDKLEKEVDKIILIDHLYLKKKGEIISSDTILVESLLDEMRRRLKRGHLYVLIKKSFLDNLRNDISNYK